MGAGLAYDLGVQYKTAPNRTPMLYSTAIALFESTDADSVLRDPVNEDWLAVVEALDGEIYDDVARRYYLALRHFRGQIARPALPGQHQFFAETRKEGLEQQLAQMEERKKQDKVTASNDKPAIFIEASQVLGDDSLPEALRDFTKSPPSLHSLFAGAGRPPCDAFCLIRAFLGSLTLLGRDSPSEVHLLLRSNPTFARACGFMGSTAGKQPGELTSRRLPSESTCREFSEVMTRYGLWHLARLEQVRSNLDDGTVEVEDTLVFDTSHVEANSHCANVEPPDAKPEAGKKAKQRKVPRLTKNCRCGEQNWEGCDHPWVPTDQGAGIVFKGGTRVHWAHKFSLGSFGNSEVPLDVRVTQYAAESDGKTLVPHLELMQRDLPAAVDTVREVIADDAYQGNHEQVAQFGDKARLIVPVHPSGRSKAAVAETFDGIDHFTSIGTPICIGGHRFEMRGRDLQNDQFIWQAPDDPHGDSVCLDCPFADDCLSKGERRHIRVDRNDFPQIDWEHPQHLARNQAKYSRRSGVERAIKRLKIDLNGENLTQRDGPRVQAHLDRRLLVIHILLSAAR